MGIITYFLHESEALNPNETVCRREDQENEEKTKLRKNYMIVNEINRKREKENKVAR